MADTFLKLDDVKGESLDSAHENEIEVHDWKWGLLNNASFELSAKDAVKKTTLKHITIEKRYDVGSVTLTNFCALGKRIPEGRLTCRKNAANEYFGGRNKINYVEITFRNIKVETIDWPGKLESGEIAETITLSFTQFLMTYWLQDNEGLRSGVVDFGFDVPTHKEINA